MKWSKKIESFLSDGEKTAGITGSVAPFAAALPALKMLRQAPSTLCVTLPDARSADLFHSEVEEFLRLTGNRAKILLIPECGRGKLLFPGGESRRARALNRILNESFDLISGSVHAWLGPAPPPQESEEKEE